MINADDMQSWAYLLAPTFQFVNTAGKPLTEGWLEVYIAGTRNKYYCASDFNGTLHPFQIPLDSLGANIVLADPSQAYDVYVYNKFGSLIMSRYHVTPVGAGGSSSVLNIVISSEDGTVTVNSDGNGNFDLSIQDTVDRVEALEDAISHINDNITVGYAIGHANTVNLDNTINLVNDGVSGIDYLQDMTGYRLKPGHIYQFNYNAKFECGEHDQYCSGKFYIEGADTVAQEWLFNLDDSYYHSECFNGSTVLVTPNNLAYYDIQLKYAWDVDYANKPDIDLNKISIVDITSIINSTGEGGGSYTAGDGIVINDTTNVISVDMNYINSHLDIDATEIIASAVNIATAYTNTVSGDIINYIDSVSGNLVDLISDVTGTIPEQVNADWNAVSGKAEILNKPDLSVYATHSEVSAVSGNLVNYVNSASGNIINYVNNVSGDIVNYVDSVSGDLVNYVDESIVSAIDVISGIIPEAQVQSNWTETDDSDPSYIQNKPVGVELVAGQNIGIFSDDTTITIAASATDLSDYATHNEVSAVSSVLENDIQTVSAALSEQIPNITIQSPSGTLVINETVSGNNKLYSIDVAANSGIEYGQFYATNITNAATMARTKGNIDVTNDGKIKLKKGQSYHVTVRGRYNQTTISDDYGYVYYIEYITNNSIIVNVDKSRSGSQYFELSYDLYKLNNDTDYYVYFTLDNAKVNDLFIEIHSLANVGGNSSGGGSSTEYDAGYGIQILNNVISVSGIYPQVNSDWNAVSGVSQILNKPDELEIVAGQNIGIFSDSNTITIAASGADLSDYATHSEVINSVSSVSSVLQNEIDAVSAAIPVVTGFATIDTVNTVSSILEQEIQTVSAAIPDVSDYATHTEVNNAITAITGLIPTDYVTHNEVSGVSGNLVNYVDESVVSAINVISGIIPEAQEQADWTETDNTEPSYIKNKPAVSGLVAGNNIAITASGSNYVISSTVTGGGTTYNAGSGINIVNDTISVDTTVIPTVSAVSAIASAYASGGGTEYTAGYGIQILNDEISVSGIYPQVNSDWTAVSGVQQILNKPNEISLVAGSGINIAKVNDELIISSTVTGGGGSGVNYQAGDHIDITNDTISVTGITELVAGTNVTITMNGDSAVISSAGGQQVQADWDEWDSSSPAYIQNKPSIPQDPEQSDWNETDPYSLAYIKNKPNISEAYTGASGIAIDNSVISLDEPLGIVAGSGINIVIDGNSAIICVSGVTGGGGSVTGNYQAGYGINIANDTISVDTTIIPNVSTVSAIVEAATGSIPTPVQVNSDWNATSGVAEILNKPIEANLLPGSGITIAASGSDWVINTTPIELVTALPANPVSGVLYLIPEA